MTWRVRTSARFDKVAAKLDPAIAARIFKSLYALAAIDDPTKHCKALTGDLVGLWRRRVGGWRIILDIHQGEMVIIAIGAGHRSNIYD